MVEIEVVCSDVIVEIGIYVVCEWSDIGNGFVVWVIGDYMKVFGEWDNCFIFGIFREEIIELDFGRYRCIYGVVISIFVDDIKVWYMLVLRFMDEICNMIYLVFNNWICLFGFLVKSIL